MDFNKINEIIAKQFADEASLQEVEELKDWLNQSDENRQIFELINKEWQENKLSYQVVNGEEISDKIWETGLGKSGKRGIKFGIDLSLYLKIAATVILIAVVSYFMLDKEPIKLPDNKVEWVTKVNPKGQKTVFALPDGTTVSLNSDSKITFPSKFDEVRKVELQGEAFFEVVKDPERPFIVLANNTSTTALGTSFNIDAFKKNVQISLVTGNVRVKDLDPSKKNHDILILEPGQAAIYKNESKEFVVKNFDPNEVISWKDGQLFFKDASFNDIIEKLELWYGVSIDVDKQLNIQQHYTGRFKNESLRNVMENISFSLRFRFEINDKSVKIMRNPK